MTGALSVWAVERRSSQSSLAEERIRKGTEGDPGGREGGSWKGVLSGLSFSGRERGGEGQGYWVGSDRY